MKTVVLAGGGLSCWYVVGKLLERGRDVDVWFAEVEQKDEALVPQFLDYLKAHKVSIITRDLRQSLGELALTLCQGQAHHPNGYWNTTGLLRIALITAAARDFQDRYGDSPYEIAHGCVGLGNDQQRFENLFGDLLPEVRILTLLSDWAQESGMLSRHAMVEAITVWVGQSIPALEAKGVWSTDGSTLGVSHEGAKIESHLSDWMQTPFVMSSDPFMDQEKDRLTLRFEEGLLTELNGQGGNAFELLSHANRRAGLRGIGRIGVMENRIKGTKCRGIYEAPGITLISAAWAALLEVCLSDQVMNEFEDLSHKMAEQIYAGRWHKASSARIRDKIAQIASKLSGEVVVVMRGGYLVIECIRTVNVQAKIEQRFANRGVCWG